MGLHIHGAMYDRVSQELSVEASIFEHESFEHLEMERIEPHADEKPEASGS